MRIVIDKDVSEIQMLNESWKKDRPTYKVRAVNADDKFVYAKGLKTLNEAANVMRDMLHDKMFSDCHPEISEVRKSGEKILWSAKSNVSESSNESSMLSKVMNKTKEVEQNTQDIAQLK